MTMTLMTLWLEPSSTERMIIANLNFVLHLISLQNLFWVLTFNGSRSPQLRKSRHFLLRNPFSNRSADG